MHDVVYGIGALAGWIAFAYKMNHLRRDWRNPALQAITIAFGFSAIAFTMTVGSVYRPIDAALGVPNLTKLFIHGSMVLFSIFVLRLLAFWQFPAARAYRRARRVFGVGLLVLVVMALLSLLAPVHDKYTIHFWKSFGAQAMLKWYLWIFLVALSAGLLAIAYRAWRFSALTGQLRWLRIGLRVTAVGALVSFGYCACRGGYLLLLAADVRVDPLVDIAEPFAAFGQVIFFTGLTMPSWGPRTAVDQAGSYRALEPLWTALHEAFPAIALHDEPAGRAEVGDLNYRLYRRMVEIWDGLLALRPYRTTPAAPTPEAEADEIQAALQRRRAGAEPSDGPDGSAPDRDDELAWLVATSRSFDAGTRELERA
jgi:hypothetical protein